MPTAAKAEERPADFFPMKIIVYGFNGEIIEEHYDARFPLPAQGEYVMFKTETVTIEGIMGPREWVFNFESKTAHAKRAAVRLYIHPLPMKQDKSEWLTI